MRHKGSIAQLNRNLVIQVISIMDKKVKALIKRFIFLNIQHHRMKIHHKDILLIQM
jgi:hypothetical protein